MTTSQKLGTVALAAAMMALGACSQGHQRASAPSSSTTAAGAAGATATTATGAATSTTAAGPAGSVAAPGGRDLASVRKTMAAVRSYSYRARTTTTGRTGAPTSNTLAGKVVSPDKTSYTATVGRRTFDIVRIGATSYRRDPGKAWTKLPPRKKPPPAPATTLLAVLDRLGPLPVPPDGKVSATLSPRDANEVGLASGPGITEPVVVAMTVDASGHVQHFEATVKVNDTRTNSTLLTQTDFSDFDAPGDITPPV